MQMMSELIITDGECLKERLQAENCISFNEALCDETVTYPIFDDAFCKLRATELGVSFQEYVEISVKSLETIKGYERLVLYFGRDMFCMINLIGLLTYLEQIGYKGNIELRLVDEETFKSLSNINYIPNLHWKDLKKLIFDLIGEVRYIEIEDNK